MASTKVIENLLRETVDVLKEGGGGGGGEGDAKEVTSQAILASVKDNENTVIDIVKEVNINGAKEATLTTVGLDAAAAKDAALAITGYALQGSNASATNTAIASTLGAPSDLDTVHTVFGHLAKLKSILDLVDTHVGSDSLTLNEKLDIIRTVIGEISLIQNNDNIGSGNQAWTLVLNQSLAVNNETLEQE